MITQFVKYQQLFLLLHIVNAKCYFTVELIHLITIDYNRLSNTFYYYRHALLHGLLLLYFRILKEN